MTDVGVGRWLVDTTTTTRGSVVIHQQQHQHTVLLTEHSWSWHGSGQCVVNVELRSVAVDGDREGGEILPELIRREGINRSNPRPPVAEGEGRIK